MIPAMKILTDRGNYLETKIDSEHKNNWVPSILMISGGASALFGIVINNIMIIGASLAIMQIGWVRYKKSRKNVDAYRKGITGEQTVINSLKNLDDNFYLINDIKFPHAHGNIDHILLGPNGIFVIETKNYRGNIECNGDEWHRLYKSIKGSKDFIMTSPSKQVKRNAADLKNFLIDAADIVKNMSFIFINGILVFTESDIHLKLNNPTVPVLKAEELHDYINDFKTNNRFTNDELEFIAKLIIDASNEVGSQPVIMTL